MTAHRRSFHGPVEVRTNARCGIKHITYMIPGHPVRYPCNSGNIVEACGFLGDALSDGWVAMRDGSGVVLYPTHLAVDAGGNPVL